MKRYRSISNFSTSYLMLKRWLRKILGVWHRANSRSLRLNRGWYFAIHNRRRNHLQKLVLTLYHILTRYFRRFPLLPIWVMCQSAWFYISRIQSPKLYVMPLDKMLVGLWKMRLVGSRWMGRMFPNSAYSMLILALSGMVSSQSVSFCRKWFPQLQENQRLKS